MAGIKKFFADLYDTITRWVNSVIDDLKAFFASLVDWIGKLLNDLAGWLRGVVSDFVEWLGRVYDSFYDRLDDLLHWLETAISDALEVLQVFFAELKAEVIAWLEGQNDVEREPFINLTVEAVKMNMEAMRRLAQELK